MSADAPDLNSIGCGILEGSNRDDMIALILQRRPEQSQDWLKPNDAPVVGQRVKVQVITEDTWGILTGEVTEMGEGLIIAIAHRSTEDETLPSGPYRLTLRHDVGMEQPWVLSRAELCDSSS